MLGLFATASLLGQNTQKPRQRSADAVAKEAATHQNLVPPPSPATSPPISMPSHQLEPANEQNIIREAKIYWAIRPEWGIVWITIAYTVIAGLTLVAIKRQANLMERQANEAKENFAASALANQDTLTALKRQADAMDSQVEHMAVQAKALIESTAIADKAQKNVMDKERARLSIGLKLMSMREPPMLFHPVTCHGTTPAFVKSGWQIVVLLPTPDLGWPKEMNGCAISGLPAVFENTNYGLSSPIMGLEGGITGQLLEQVIASGSMYLHCRMRIVYEDIFENTHELSISKVYGLPSGSPLGSIQASVSTVPEWRDSE